MMRNQVFISYRQETPEHAAAVRRLGELLRLAEIPVMLDQIFLDEHPGGPDEGWPKWCEDCANESACVVIIASEGWFACYEKRDQPGVGLGAATEADLFRQALWNLKGHNARTRLAFLNSNVAASAVPARLQAWHSFRPFDTTDQLNQMIRWIAEHLHLGGIGLPTVRWPAPVEFQPNLADRSTREWPAVVDLLAGRSRERILLFEASSGLGKSELIRQAAAYATKVGLPLALVDFKGGTLKIEEVLGQLDLELGNRLPNFSREGANKTHLLRKDLRALREPVLLILDTWEDAVGNKAVEGWLNQQLLPEVETSLGIAVIVAGQKVPDLTNAPWRDLGRHIPLGPITDIKDWKEWVARRYPTLLDKGYDLATLVAVSRGSPLVMSGFFAGLAKS
jgi:hypothetical protein